MNRKLLTVIPDIVAAAYGSGDVIGTPREILGAVRDSGGQALLKSIVVSDKANVKAALDLVFFSGVLSTSPGADNAPYALADADTVQCLGRISVAGADYVSSGTNNAEATIKNIDLMLQAAAGKQSIYLVVVSRGTPTYASASDLTIRLGVEQ